MVTVKKKMKRDQNSKESDYKVQYCLQEFQANINMSPFIDGPMGHEEVHPYAETIVSL